MRTLKQYTVCSFIIGFELNFTILVFFLCMYYVNKFCVWSTFTHYQLFTLRPHSTLWDTADELESFIPTDGTNSHRQLLLLLKLSYALALLLATCLYQRERESFYNELCIFYRILFAGVFLGADLFSCWSMSCKAYQIVFS